MLDLTNLRHAVRYEGGVSRRLFLSYSAALAGLPSLAARAVAAERQPTFAANPFSLGVASGDPDASSVVIWTKLAPQPLDPDGGMQREPVTVVWELAEDDAMQRPVASGTAIATAQLGHSVHVTVRGLKPDRWYWYRFRAGDADSPMGRARTLPAADAAPQKLRFAFASCQNYEHGFYAAYRQMAQDDLDLVFHLGDYIYETPGGKGGVRQHTGPVSAKLKTLADYRQRHMQYRADPLLHAMHANCPWFVTWDDHEVENNYANDIREEQPAGESEGDVADFLIQRAAAYQAYYEMMPLGRRSLPKAAAMQLYRRAAFGTLAEFFILDTRQYRTDQPNGDGVKPLNDEAFKPGNTLLGQRQRGWLEAGLIASQGTWNVLAQQVMMAMVEVTQHGSTGYWMDQWPGAARERAALLTFIEDRRVPNPIVIAGDVHSNWVNDLRRDDRKTGTPVIATEFVGTSISSGGNEAPEPRAAAALLAANPCVRYFDKQRGYVRCTVTPQLWTSDYVEVDDVTQPAANVVTRASFVVEAGAAGAKPA